MILPPSHCFVPFGPLNCALTSFAKSKVTLMLQQPHKTRSGGWTADRYTEAAGKRTPDRRGTGMGREWRGSRDSSEGALKHRRAGGGGGDETAGVPGPSSLPLAFLARSCRAARTRPPAPHSPRGVTLISGILSDGGTTAAPPDPGAEPLLRPRALTGGDTLRRRSLNCASFRCAPRKRGRARWAF